MKKILVSQTFKFQYDNTLSHNKRSQGAYSPIIFKFQYDNTLR